MSERFVLATHNPGKVLEMREILSELGLEVLAPDDIGVSVDVEETGSTFVENATLKAKAVCALTGLPAIGDDSGLCVNALNGGPGVYSARYGGENISDEQRNKLLLESVKGQGTRDAHFSCAIVCAFPNGDAITAEGRCDGVISYIPMGNGGFGYDPVFNYPPKLKTFAQMTPEEKSEVSHRGKALREFAEKLGAYLSELAWKELEEEKARQEASATQAESVAEEPESVTEVTETPEGVPEVTEAPEITEVVTEAETVTEVTEAEVVTEVTEAESVPEVTEAPKITEVVTEAEVVTEVTEAESVPEVTEAPKITEVVTEAEVVTEVTEAESVPEVTEAPKITEVVTEAESVTEVTEAESVTETPDEEAKAVAEKADAAPNELTHAEPHPHKHKRKRKKHH